MATKTKTDFIERHTITLSYMEQGIWILFEQMIFYKMQQLLEVHYNLHGNATETDKAEAKKRHDAMYDLADKLEHAKNYLTQTTESLAVYERTLNASSRGTGE